MIVKNFYIRKDQYNLLRAMNGTASEHVRIAIDDYISKQKRIDVKKQRETLHIATSLSHNGR